jgi:hypothetical protein
MALNGGFFEHIGGRFRFRGPSTAAVVDGIEATAKDYQLRIEPA